MTGVRVFNPRGERGGGGLVIQITVSEAEVQRWIGVDEPSALARISVERGIDAQWKSARREAVAALGQREVVERRQPGGPAREGSGPPPREPGTGVSMATAGPIAQGTEGDPT